MAGDLCPSSRCTLIKIHSHLHQTRGEGVPQIMEVEIFNLGIRNRRVKGASDVILVDRRMGATAEDKIRLQ